MIGFAKRQPRLRRRRILSDVLRDVTVTDDNEPSPDQASSTKDAE